MFEYYFETDFDIVFKNRLSLWIKETIQEEKQKVGNIVFVFCDDTYLLEKNIRYLNHNTLTDIISFDYTDDELVSGDIFISIDRVRANAKKFKVDFNNELNRVMIHGILHFLGYKDKTEEEK